MDSIKLAEFLFSRVKETIDYKPFIAGVSINFEHNETYGNDYIQVFYEILVNKNFEKLDYDKRQSCFHKTPKYIFSLSTNKEKYKERKKMLRILEFKNIYESLASYALLELEKYLDPQTSIKIKGIDMWPEANLVTKYLLSNSNDSYKSVMHSYFNLDIHQWGRLHDLAMKSRKIYTKEKKKFNITDLQINEVFGLDLHSIHSMLLNYAVAIKIKGTKTIDEIQIHTPTLVEVLKRELISNKYLGEHDTTAYKKLITYTYYRYLPLKKTQIIKQQQIQYLQCFIIQPGDILQLKNMRIVMANIVSFDQKYTIKVKYTILKNNLQLSERTREIEIGDILFVLKQPLFLEFMGQTLIKHLSLLRKWMLNRKVKFDFISFESDLTKEMDNSDKSK